MTAALRRLVVIILTVVSVQLTARLMQAVWGWSTYPAMTVGVVAGITAGGLGLKFLKPNEDRRPEG